MESSLTKESSKISEPFFSLVKNPLKFNLFLLQKLPAAYFSGLKLKEVNDQACVVSVPYKWFTKNPFGSTYFACLSMAAEMSTGMLAMAGIYKRKPSVSMLVTGVESSYYKKATDTVDFICNSGNEILQAIEKAIETKSPQTIRVASKGFNRNKELVAEFWITWSFKARN